MPHAACLLQEASPKPGVSTYLLAIPTVFDLVATVLMNIGLLSVTASVYQMMRGAEMLFAALFAVVFLRRTLNRFHLLGILCCVVRACRPRAPAAAAAAAAVLPCAAWSGMQLWVPRTLMLGCIACSGPLYERLRMHA